MGRQLSTARSASEAAASEHTAFVLPAFLSSQVTSGAVELPMMS